MDSWILCLRVEKILDTADLEYDAMFSGLPLFSRFSEMGRRRKRFDDPESDVLFGG